MSQPPQGEQPQDGGWGPPSSGSGQGGGWGAPAGGHGPYPPPGQYGQPGGWGSPSQYGPPGQYGPPQGQYGQPGQYGSPYGQPGQYGVPTGYGPPPQPGQYGGWGQPPQPARRRSGYGKVFWLLVAVLVIALAFILPSRLGSTRLDPQSVQRDVAAQYEQREGVGIDLRCDQPMTVRDGRSYECAGTTADDQQVTITITITSQDGDYTWSDS
jgi:Domain of unknown function (DUF4333)